MNFVFLGDYLLSFINPNVGVWSPTTLLVLISLMSVERFQNCYLILGAAGNDVICLRSQIVSGSLNVMFVLVLNAHGPFFVV